MQIDHLTRAAIQHTLHCLLGCSIGEVLGMVIATSLGWSNAASIALAVALAFFFGYALTAWSMRRKGMELGAAVRAAVATDTVSIISMETVDNAFLLMVPGAMDAHLDSALFWWSLAVALAVAFVLTVPVNRWFISRSSHAHMHH